MLLKKLLLLNDFVSTSHVALNVQADYLIANHEEFVALPTAIISNTFNLGKPQILDTSDYINQSLSIYQSFNIDFSVVLIGYLHTIQQANLIKERLSQFRSDSIILDPIMGDKGRLYQSVSLEIVGIYQMMLSNADIVVPNLTEAQLLLDYSIIKTAVTKEEIAEIVMSLHQLSSKAVVITSAMVDGQSLVVGYDHQSELYFEVPYEYIEGSFYGTGDLFSVALAYRLHQGHSLVDAVTVANNTVAVWIKTQQRQNVL